MTKKKPKKAQKPVKAGTSKEAAKQRRLAFIEAYMVNGGNATEAAKTAGFSVQTARQQGSRLLSDVAVKAELEARARKLHAEHGITTERVLKELSRIAFADLRQAYDARGALLPPHLWPDDVAAAMAGVDVVEMAGGMEIQGDGGMMHVPMFTKKVKLWDKNAALEKAMKHLGMFEKDNKQTATQFVLLDAADQRA